MPVKLVFLGRLEDLAGPELQIETPASLAAAIAGLEPAVAAAVSEPRIRVAVNGVVIIDPTSVQLRDGDEVAFLPPVSGG